MTSQASSRSRKIKRLALWLVLPPALLVALVVLWFPLSKLNLLPPFLRTAGFKPLQRPEARDARWQQDLAYYASQMPRLHKNLYHTTDKVTFDAAVDRLAADIPELTDAEIIVRFMALTALVGDGHTTVGYQSLYQDPWSFHHYPLGVGKYEGGWYIMGALPEYKELIGVRLVAIDGVPTEEIFDTVGAIVSHDNVMQLFSSAETPMMTPEILRALGLIDRVESATFSVTTSNGDERDVVVSAVGFAALQDAVTVDEFFGEGNVPLARQNEKQWYWYSYLPEEQSLYFQYDQCGNMKGLSYKDFNAEMFEFIDSHDVDRVIVDLRYNGGGNSLVLNPFLKALEERSNLSVFALIGRRTFSSALMNAIQLDELGATLVGEPTGGRPNHYGEVRVVRLPNSGLPIYYATRYFREVEGTDQASLEPDISVPISIDDQLTGYDAALEIALNP